MDQIIIIKFCYFNPGNYSLFSFYLMQIPIKAESPEESFIDDDDEEEEDEEEETADDDDVDFSEEENNETIIKDTVEPFVASEKHDVYQKDEKQNEIAEKPEEKTKSLEDKKADEKKVEEKKEEEKREEEQKENWKKEGKETENDKTEEEKKVKKEEKKVEKEEEKKDEKEEAKKEEKDEKKNQDVVIEDTIYRDDYDYNHPDDELDKNEESVEGSGTGTNFGMSFHFFIKFPFNTLFSVLSLQS